MSEEWRTLPEFMNYEITADGDLRNKWTLKKLNETENKKTGVWAYSLRFNDGRSTHRNFWGLVYSAFPELKPVEEPKPERIRHRAYAKRGAWVVIPDFPKYQMHPNGRVRYTATRQPRKALWDSIMQVEYVILFNDNGQHRKTIRRLLRECFPEIQEQAA
jgi:hypothetical protein